MIAKLKDLFSRLSITEVIALGIVAVVLIVGIVMAKDKISDWWHGKKQEIFDAKMAAADKKVADLQSTNDQLRGQVTQDQKNAQDLELQRDALKKQLEDFGKAGQIAVQKQEDAEKQYEADKQNIAADASLFDRCVQLCASRSAIGYPCKPDVQQYCQQYRQPQ
jgi:regulator of replication initiation timing